jgi:hypothetical protein
MKNSRQLIIILGLFFVSISFAQDIVLSTKQDEVYGVVLDKKTKEPIAGASVYFDNTTVGMITDFEGEFAFNLDNKINATLVVSFVGYKTKIIPDPKSYEKYTILLEEDVNALEEVFVEYKDEWSRAYKLKQFRKEFLGTSKLSKACTILNEDDIILRFNSDDKQLTAYAKQPIIIKNDALDYEISYDLKEFTVQYGSSNTIKYNLEDNKNKASKVFVVRKKTNRTVERGREPVEDNKDKRYYLKSVYYAGTAFFKTVASKNHKRVLRKREKAYKGSVPHFMRSIVNNTLKKDGYKIFKGTIQVYPGLYILTEKLEGQNLTKVKVRYRLNILYNKKQQSAIESKVDTFTVDVFGNHSNISQVLFGGVMGDQRLGDTLPLDYGLN